MPVRGAGTTIIQEGPIPSVSETTRNHSLNSADKKTNEQGLKFSNWLNRNKLPITAVLGSSAALVAAPILLVTNVIVAGTAISIAAFAFCFWGAGVIDLIDDWSKQCKMEKTNQKCRDAIAKIQEYQRLLPNENLIRRAASLEELLAIAEPWKAKRQELKDYLKKNHCIEDCIPQPCVDMIKTLIKVQNNPHYDPKDFIAYRDHLADTVNKSWKATDALIKRNEELINFVEKHKK